MGLANRYRVSWGRWKFPEMVTVAQPGIPNNTLSCIKGASLWFVNDTSVKLGRNPTSAQARASLMTLLLDEVVTVWSC